MKPHLAIKIKKYAYTILRQPPIPEVVVFKTDTAAPELMKEEDWYKVNVITCAAPNLRANPSNRYNSGDGNEAAEVANRELMEIHERRLRRILDVAASDGNEVVILGAFGCGAFCNDPEVVAQAAKNVIADYRYAFRTIEFAVYCSPRDEENYLVFDEVIVKDDMSHKCGNDSKHFEFKSYCMHL